MVAKIFNQHFTLFRVSRFDPLGMTTALILLVTTGARFYFGADQPLWLDETFTGAIAALPSLAEVLHQSLLDVNAPLYYVIAHCWSSVFGVSNEALRAPALLFACLAPLLCVIPTRSLSRRTHLIWCALTALWAPGLEYAQEARCYSLLLCLSVLGTVLFVRLLERPDLRRAAAWSLVGCLTILTHYYALILIGCQGLAWFATAGMPVRRTWPAAILFVPAFAWLFLHASRIADFAAPNIAWYPPLKLADLLSIISFLTGTIAALVLLSGLCSWAWMRSFWHVRKEARSPSDAFGSSQDASGPSQDDSGPSRDALGPRREAGENSWSAWVTVYCAWTGAGLVTLLAFARPTLTLRYIIPFVPGVLLGFALSCERLRKTWKIASCVLVILYASASLRMVASFHASKKIYNFQRASDALMEAKPRELVFFWDHPATLIEDRSQLAIVGGFFFERRGVHVAVTPFKVARHVDPNPELIALVQKPGASLLWIYDKNIHDTAAKEFAPRIDALARGITCRDFGAESVGIIACSAEMHR